ncbi:N-acetyltransferase [Pseudomonas saudimassiliensis]|nr:N-acetyltransferase [Pseudomonas saudimassiliensis]
MIRDSQADDIDAILDIWLSASIQAHDFIDSSFWISKVGDMREIYLPASQTRVYEAAGKVLGFYSLYEDTLAAIFVAPGSQGQGIGSVLLADAKTQRPRLQLMVYKENAPSIQFYEKHGFTVAGEQTDEHTGHAELLMEFSRQPNKGS